MHPHEAVSKYFDALCSNGGVEAVALTTEDGTLIAGAGRGDIEWMASVGASSRLSKLRWDDRELHVRRLELNAVPMCLTLAGGDAALAEATVRRIFSA